MASSMWRIISSWSGARSSNTTPPSEAENRFGSLDTRTTSACRSTAQYPVPSGISCQWTGSVRRRWSKTSCGGPAT